MWGAFSRLRAVSERYQICQQHWHLRAPGPAVPGRSSLTNSAALFEANASKPVAGKLEHQIFNTDPTEGKFSLRGDQRSAVTDEDQDDALLLARCLRPGADLAVVRLLAPGRRIARIAANLDHVFGVGDDEPRSVGLPFRTQPFVDQPIAQERPALVRSVLVDPAAVSGLAVRAPLALRLVQCRDAQDLATECAASACAARNRFIRGHRRRFRRQCGNVAATGDRPDHAPVLATYRNDPQPIGIL